MQDEQQKMPSSILFKCGYVVCVIQRSKYSLAFVFFLCLNLVLMALIGSRLGQLGCTLVSLLLFAQQLPLPRRQVRVIIPSSGLALATDQQKKKKKKKKGKEKIKIKKIV